MTERVLAVGQVWRAETLSKEQTILELYRRHTEGPVYVESMSKDERVSVRNTEKFNAWIDRTGAVLVAG